MDYAPSVRVALCRGMQLDNTGAQQRPKRAKGSVVDINAAVNAVIAVGGRSQVPGVKNGVLMEPSVRIINFYATGDALICGARYRVPKILIDGGAVVNLMPESAARRLGLELMENSDIMIRTATNEIRPVKYYTRFKDPNCEGYRKCQGLCPRYPAILLTLAGREVVVSGESYR